MDPEQVDEVDRLLAKLKVSKIEDALDHFMWLPTVFGDATAIEIMSAALHDWADWLKVSSNG